MATTGFRPEPGARFRMRTQHLSPTGWVEAEVLAFDPPRRMAWAWTPGAGAAPTTVVFELTPRRAGRASR